MKSDPKAVKCYWPDIGQTPEDAQDVVDIDQVYLSVLAEVLCSEDELHNRDLWDGDERDIALICEDGSEVRFTVEREVVSSFIAHRVRETEAAK